MFVLLLYRIVLMQAKAGEKRETRGDTLKREKRGRVISPLSSSFLQTKGNQSVLLFLRLADVDTVTVKKTKRKTFNGEALVCKPAGAPDLATALERKLLILALSRLEQSELYE